MDTNKLTGDQYYIFILFLKASCEHYFKVNQAFPEKIIIYRDGVSDGQLTMVLEHEIPQIVKAFPLIDNNYKYD